MGDIIVGIDLGTTKSAIAIYENDQPTIYQNRDGARITPSFVALKKTGEWIVGKAAKNQVVMNPANTIYGAKRLIGRRFDEPEVKKMQTLAGYKIVPGPNGDAYIEIGGKAISPVEVGAMVLREMKEAVEKKIGKPVTKAVITVPAYFNNAQRQATKDAGKIAGLDVLRIINEPTAAALAYGMDKKKSGKVAVYDLGGGTFDVSILDLSLDPKTGSMIQVLATNGDTFLGGENFDERITEHLIKQINKEHGTDIDPTNPASKAQYATQIGRIREAAEKVKIELSTQQDAEVSLPFLMPDAENNMINFTYTMSRKELEDLVDDLIKKTLPPFQKSLDDAGLKLSDIDDVLMVGAQTRMPKVVEVVKQFTGKTPRQDVTPDEIVAMGASVQGAILQGGLDNVILLDVIPLSIGIRTAGGVNTIMIPKNTAIPTEVKDVFSTAEDNQRDVQIRVSQGERPDFKDNKELGNFSLEGIPPARANTPKIEVCFAIDADGVLSVSATDQKTGKSQKAVFKANGGLSEADVAKMLKDAEDNKEKDAAIAAARSAEVAADYEVKEAAKDTKEEYFLKAPQELKDEFNKAVQELGQAREQKNTAAIVEKTEVLKNVRIKIGEAFSNAAADTPAPQPEAAAPDATPKAPTPPAPPAPGA